MPRTIPSYLHQLPTRQLGEMAPIGAVHTKRLAECHYEKGSLRNDHGTYPTSPPTETHNNVTSAGRLNYTDQQHAERSLGSHEESTNPCHTQRVHPLLCRVSGLAGSKRSQHHPSVTDAFI